MAQYKVFNPDTVDVSQMLRNGDKAYIPAKTFAVYDRRITAEMFDIFPSLEVVDATDSDLKEYEKSEKERKSAKAKIEAELKAQAEKKAKADEATIKAKLKKRAEEEEKKLEEAVKIAEETTDNEIEAIAEVASYTPVTVPPVVDEGLKSMPKKKGKKK